MGRRSRPRHQPLIQRPVTSVEQPCSNPDYEISRRHRLSLPCRKDSGLPEKYKQRRFPRETRGHLGNADPGKTMDENEKKRPGRLSRQWLPDEIEEMKRMAKECLPARLIAYKLNRTILAVRSVAWRRKISLKRSRHQ
jgi:hypothetical protein